MAQTTVNQVPLDFASIETEVIAPGGQSLGLVSGLDEFDYTVTINRTEMYGPGRLPMKKPTEGDAEFAGSITVLRFWYDWLVAQAHDLGIPLAELSCTINFTYYGKDPSTGDRILHVDTLTDVMLNEIGNSGSRGPDSQMVSMPLRVGNIFFDGVDVFGNTL